MSHRPPSRFHRDWWDYSTLPAGLLTEAAALDADDLIALSRPGFRVVMHDTIEDFYLAEALEYIAAWRRSRDDAPVGVCGPIGPTEHLPLVARLIGELALDLRSAHFWGMDEWVVDDRAVDPGHPLSFAGADRRLCFDRLPPHLRLPDAHLHFPTADGVAYRASWNAGVRCVLMQGGQGDSKHWAFNEPPQRIGPWREAPPSPAEYRALATRVVDLHPLTLMQNARTSAAGDILLVPTRAVTVGPVETWQAEQVSIWQAGMHDNPLGQRLTALMVGRRIVDTAVPMSLLADHPQVEFHYLRSGLGTCQASMH